MKNPDKIYFGKTVREHEAAIRVLVFHRMNGLTHDKPFTLRDELAIWIKNFYNDDVGIPELVDYYSDLYNLK